MRTPSRTIGTLLGVILLAGSLAACDEKEPPAAAPPSTSDAAAAASSDPTPAPEVPAPEDPAVPAQDTPEDMPTSQDPAEPGEDPTAWDGPGEDPATMQDDVPREDPNAVVVDYETLPGDCHNDVPLPDSKHGVVSTESFSNGECLVVIDSRGDSLYMINDISEQLRNAGFTQTSAPSTDDGPDALNTVSYQTQTHEVWVTVQQDGVSGVIITYALTDSGRGNG